ncbi:hypothetical protein M5D96_010553, partial [Drosophila gunungcola]
DNPQLKVVCLVEQTQRYNDCQAGLLLLKLSGCQVLIVLTCGGFYMSAIAKISLNKWELITQVTERFYDTFHATPIKCASQGRMIKKTKIIAKIIKCVPLFKFTL